MACFLASRTTTPRAESFHATRWTRLRAAHATEATPSQSLDALPELRFVYLRPLSLFLRGSGCGVADVQELIQGFLADVIERRFHARPTQAKGRICSFLLGPLKHLVAAVHHRAYALKRGGGKLFHPLDEEALTLSDPAEVADELRYFCPVRAPV